MKLTVLYYFWSISSVWFAGPGIKSRLERRLSSGELALSTFSDAVNLPSLRLRWILSLSTSNNVRNSATILTR